MELARHHQIHGVQPVLPVPDVAAAIDWFVRTLGFALDFAHGEPAHYARVKLGDRSWGDPVYLHLCTADADDAAAPASETRLDVGHDIDGLHRHLLSAGAQVLEAPTDQPWGLREVVVLAPGGHRLVLGAELPGAEAAPAPVMVIASFRPLSGQAEALHAVVREHVPTLQRLGLATHRPPMAMQAGDGTVVEVFEWASAEAIEQAHSHPEVLAMWQRFAAACEYVHLGGLAEAAHPFSEFRPLAP